MNMHRNFERVVNMTEAVSSIQGNKNRTAAHAAIISAGAAAGAAYGITRIPNVLANMITDTYFDKTKINQLSREEKQDFKAINRYLNLQAIKNRYFYHYPKIFINGLNKKINKAFQNFPEKYKNKAYISSGIINDAGSNFRESLRRPEKYLDELFFKKAKAAFIITPAIYAGLGVLVAGTVSQGIKHLVEKEK